MKKHTIEAIKDDAPFFTYKDLLDYLKKLTPAQLNQQVQTVLCTPDDDEVQELTLAIGIDTIANWEIESCRSSVDNKYHEEEIVLLLTHNPFREDGAIAIEWNIDGPDVPIYGVEGPTNPNDQRRKE